MWQLQGQRKFAKRLQVKVYTLYISLEEDLNSLSVGVWSGISCEAPELQRVWVKHDCLPQTWKLGARVPLQIHLFSITLGKPRQHSRPFSC